LGANKSLIFTITNLALGAPSSSGKPFLFQTLEKKEKKKKNQASSKKLLTSIKEKGPLGKKSPFTRKEKWGSVSFTHYLLCIYWCLQFSTFRYRLQT